MVTMKKIRILVILVVAFALCISSVQAHFLITDNQIGALLHVNPNDDPVAGEPATFFFELKDKENKFDPAQCDCTFTVSENGAEIHSQALYSGSNEASVIYTFPQKSIYTVTITGKPNGGAQFQHFSLSWNFRIETEKQQSDSNSEGKLDSRMYWAITTFAGVTVCGILLFIAWRKKKSV